MKPYKKFEEFSVIEVVKDVMASNRVPLEPVTPDTERENGNFPFDLKSQLWFVSSSPKKQVCNDSNSFLDPGCKTRENSNFLRKGKMVISIRNPKIL